MTSSSTGRHVHSCGPRVLSKGNLDPPLPELVGYTGVPLTSRDSRSGVPSRSRKVPKSLRQWESSRRTSVVHVSSQLVSENRNRRNRKSLGRYFLCVLCVSDQCVERGGVGTHSVPRPHPTEGKVLKSPFYPPLIFRKGYSLCSDTRATPPGTSVQLPGPSPRRVVTEYLGI